VSGYCDSVTLCNSASARVCLDKPGTRAMFASLLNDAVAGLLGTRFATAPADVVVDNVRGPTQQPTSLAHTAAQAAPAVSLTLTRCIFCLPRLWTRLKTPAV